MRQYKPTLNRVVACSQVTKVWKSSVLVFALLICLSVPARAHNSRQSAVFDIQCGCYANPANAAELVTRLQELDLPWYSRRLKRCIRFILDVNVDHQGRTAFMTAHPEFADAFLVQNFWNIPRPLPEEISPLPTKQVFTAIMAPYMRNQYQHGYYNRSRLPMATRRARIYTRWIYEAATYYGLDPFLLFAVGNFETYFRNMLGDLDRMKRAHPDPAQGMFQILRSTARNIYQDMRSSGVPHAPEELPADLRTHPKTQIFFAAHYLHMLHMKQHGNRYMALLAYNGTGSGSYDYPRRVMRFYQKALTYFIQNFGRISKVP
ncbi:MAG: transglycosylase SLT domain-containing protein [Deltaproteobacteria bacterium]|nr:MAG: transglycosylase SLT domain-containing protein [Deltaproteobacteria bacterium]